MAISTPSYITRNRFGVYIFQYRIPNKIRDNCPELRLLFRKSLRTRCKVDALKLARVFLVIMDELARKYFNDPVSYGKAVELLTRYELEVERGVSFHELEENLLLNLTEYEDYLLEKAISLRGEQKSHNEKLHDEIKFLKRVIQDSNTNIAAQFEDENNPLITELKEKWEADIKRSMRKSSYLEYIRNVETFLSIIEFHNERKVPRTNGLNVELIRKYKNTLAMLPKGKLPQNLSNAALEKSNLPRRSPSTINIMLGRVGHFVKWMSDEGYDLQNNIYSVLKANSRVKKSERKKRIPFTDEDLNKLFNSREYSNGLFKRPSDYWAPLISLFTGATSSEILQLHKTDIRKHEGIDVIDFNDDIAGKTLKVYSSNENTGRARIIPIHPILIKLGLIEFVNSSKNKNRLEIFWQEEKNCNGKFGSFSRRFNRYKEKHGVKADNEKAMKDFHSFRHLVRTKLSDVERFDGIIDDILGHSSSSRSSIGENYNHADRLSIKLNAIKQITYKSIDFNLIKNWEFCAFNK